MCVVSCALYVCVVLYASCCVLGAVFCVLCVVWCVVCVVCVYCVVHYHIIATSHHNHIIII